MSASPGVTLITVTSPPPGAWDVSLNGVGGFSLNVSAQSSINVSFSFAEVQGRPGHSGWAPNPNIDGGQFSDIMHQIRDANGDTSSDNLTFLLGSGELGRPSKIPSLALSIFFSPIIISMLPEMIQPAIHSFVTTQYPTSNSSNPNLPQPTICRWRCIAERYAIVVNRIRCSALAEPEGLPVLEGYSSWYLSRHFGFKHQNM